MEEKIYTIPVNDAFHASSECPVCSMYDVLEKDAIEFMTGTAYMEADIREETDHLGFCKPHMKMVAAQKNRLGIALILKTHLDQQIKECNKEAEKGLQPKSLFKKNTEETPVVFWAKQAVCNCYICKRIDFLFPRYIDTILYLYKRDQAFRELYRSCKGFCQEHYGLLIEKGVETLSKKDAEEFFQVTTKLYTDNLQRLSDDLDWFRYKFDYRYKDEPWKESKDSIERGIVKTSGILPKE